MESEDQMTVLRTSVFHLFPTVGGLGEWVGFRLAATLLDTVRSLCTFSHVTHLTTCKSETISLYLERRKPKLGVCVCMCVINDKLVAQQMDTELVTRLYSLKPDLS